MPLHETLAEYCALATADGRVSSEVAGAVLALAHAATGLADLIALGPLAGALGEAVGRNTDGDTQKELDRRSHEIVMAALRQASVATVLSEEGEGLVSLDPQAKLAVAIDPLDGSSNIDTNISIGTIFSIIPNVPADATPLGPFHGPGKSQLAAGFVVYGPQTALVLTMGHGVDIFTQDPRDSAFRLTRMAVKIREGHREYAINASNYRHWEPPVRIYIDDCLNGAAGLRGADFNMRWTGSLVAEAFRILTRGGIFLYPGDARPGYENGRLRLLYEAFPMAFVIEQAGGLASTGRERILDIVPHALHQRVPLIFGATDKVRRLDRLHQEPASDAERAPLFGQRGLFRN